MIMKSDNWQGPLIASLFSAAILYSVFIFLEKEKWYKKLLVEKEPGEIKKSNLMLFMIFSVMVVIAWELCQKPFIISTSILMWGMGDGTAALVGVPFGKHKVNLKGTDDKKSWKGSISMLLVSFLFDILSLIICSSMPLLHMTIVVMIGSFLGTATELFTSGKYDTATVPIVITISFLVLEYIWKY